MASTFREMIEFMDRIGVYDVILPFLLVFSAVFAILEKTKILGTEEYDGKKYTRKNQNAMMSFVISFLVVASSELVRTINEAMANVVLLILLSISFMLLLGSIHTGDEEFFLEKGPWRTAFTWLFFVGIIGVFLDAIHYKGQPFLEYAWDYVVQRWDTNWFGSLILIGILIGFMVFITKEPRPIKHKGGGSSDSKEGGN
ncbi:hypothetical protein GOV08_00055 [Candidatus Woesearchaeota archaeon]|nr:hypothetical protein [Candidatus Woesearchaeota archaeon]